MSILNGAAIGGAILSTNRPVVAQAPAADLVVKKIRYYPRSIPANTPILQQRMVGGKFQGSNVSNSAGFVDLFTITTTPPEGQFSESPILANTTAYQWVRYVSPNGSNGNVAEIELRNAAGQKLVGTVFGVGEPNAGRPELGYAMAWDGDVNTYVDGDSSNGNITGLMITGVAS